MSHANLVALAFVEAFIHFGKCPTAKGMFILLFRGGKSVGALVFYAAQAGKLAANICPARGANGQMPRQNFSRHQATLYFVLNPPVVSLDLLRILPNLRNRKCVGADVRWVYNKKLGGSTNNQKTRGAK